MASRTEVAAGRLGRPSLADTLKAVVRDRILVLMVVPVIAYYLVFHYYPMYGVIIAFKRFSATKGILRSEWAGLRYFEQFFRSVYFGRLLKNTVLISVYQLIFGFPVPILFALALNELKPNLFKRTVQTVSYLPHFISVVVVVGMLINFLSPQDGVVNMVLRKLGREPINFMIEPRYFRPLFIGSNIWQSFGWNSIIYLAALSSIDAELYEAARIDGANRFRQIRHITIPGLLPTIVILLILAVGSIMNVGFEKIILMYNPTTYSTADVISTYTYRRGIVEAQYSFGAAVGLFNALINFALLLSVNRISRGVSEISLW
jgi:putative aldouronate transport system permease protein